MKTEYWVLVRNKQTHIVVIIHGADPLYGMGSWNILAGPLNTRSQAEKVAVDYEKANR